MEIFNNKNIAAFRQHGFNPISISGEDHIVGNCIFCNGSKSNGDDKIFFINVNTKKWDCKLCGESGGYKMFIEKVVQYSQSEWYSVKKISELAKRRQLKISTIKSMNIGYNSNVDSFIYPTYDINNKEIMNIAIFKWNGNKKERSITEGGHQWILGSDILKTDFTDIWIVEGHWDFLVMKEIFTDLKIKDAMISLPGSSFFKDEIVRYFQNKRVHVVLHADHEHTINKRKVMGAGPLGMIKLYNKLNSIVESIDFIHWKEDLKNGYDINDLYIDNKCNTKITFDIIKSLLNSLPKGIETSKLLLSTSQSSNIRYKGKGVLPEDLYKIYREHLELKTTDMIDVTLGCIIGNRLPADSIWLYLIGPSGTAKSVMCQAINCHYDIEAIDSFTASTLCSGSITHGGVDASMAPRIHGRIVVTKDWTTLLELPHETYRVIMGDLRAMFDGIYEKGFGNGSFKKTFFSKFGYIAGATHALESYTEGDTSLGERWIKFNIPSEDIYAIMRKMNDNLINGRWNNALKTLQSITREAIDFNYDLNSIELSDKIIDFLMNCAIIIEDFRGTVPIDKFSKEITYEPRKAQPTRSFMQMRKELTGICAFKRHQSPDENDVRLIKSIVKSTIPLSRERILAILVYNGIDKEVGLNILIDKLKLPSVTIQRTIQKLIALDVMYKVSDRGLKIYYKLTDRMINLIERTGIYNGN